MVWYKTLKFVARLEYEYVQVAVDLFCENVTPVQCSVMVEEEGGHTLHAAKNYFSETLVSKLLLALL